MSSDQDDGKGNGERSEADLRTEQLQTYTDQLAGVILAGGMCHGVTVTVSVGHPERGQILVSSSKLAPGGSDRLAQADYGIAHFAALEENSRQAKENLKEARRKTIQQRGHGAVQ